MEPGPAIVPERQTVVASILMPKALEDGVETTADAYGAKPKHERGETTCAGERCGVPVVYQRAHRRPHRDGYVEMFAGFRLGKASGHAPTCDIDLQLGAKRRGVMVVTSRTVAAAAILTMAMDPEGKGRVVDERLLRVRWDAAAAAPSRVTVATPSVTYATVADLRSGRPSKPVGKARSKRITSAADIERERLAIVNDDDPKTAAKQLSILLGDDPDPIGWSAFFHNWDLNTAATIEQIVDGIERGSADSGVAFAAKIDGRPKREHGTWQVRCRTVSNAEETRLFSLVIVFADRAIASRLAVGRTYVFAGPEVTFKRVVSADITHETVSVGVLSKQWITPSQEVRPEQIERLRRKSA